jgi:DNA-binding FadR family transcriptional regulator
MPVVRDATRSLAARGLLEIRPAHGQTDAAPDRRTVARGAVTPTEEERNV